MVVDDWKAKLWAQVLTKIKIHDDIVLRDPDEEGLGDPQGQSQARRRTQRFLPELGEEAGSRSLPAAAIHEERQGAEQSRRLPPTTSGSNEVVALFEKYGQQYNFDPLMLAAQGYQESTLDQSKKSRVGAIGVMQIMPATGQGLKVGDIKVTESNIHGGTKYMDQLMTQYFQDATFDEQNRTLFAFASYNAGPGNIARMRKEAEKRGLDPNRWFNNVEVVTAEKIGIETTTYVRNIYKYYVSYKLTADARAQVEKAKQQVTPGKS